MSHVRVIPCLDTLRGVLVKGVSFVDLRELGDPLEYAKRYEEEGADEIAILDIGASTSGKSYLLEVVSRVSREVSVPIIAGGGVKRVDDALKLIDAGASKVSVNTAAVLNPELIRDLARELGSESVVLAIDARRVGDQYRVFIRGGRVDAGLDAIEWARRGVELGAGELLVTSIDADGRRAGYDTRLIELVSRAARAPIIASGGAGSPRDMLEAVRAGASGVLAASIFHYGMYTVREVKEYLLSQGVSVRL